MLSDHSADDPFGFALDNDARKAQQMALSRPPLQEYAWMESAAASAGLSDDGSSTYLTLDAADQQAMESDTFGVMASPWLQSPARDEAQPASAFSHDAFRRSTFHAGDSSDCEDDAREEEVDTEWMHEVQTAAPGLNEWNDDAHVQQESHAFSVGALPSAFSMQPGALQAGSLASQPMAASAAVASDLSSSQAPSLRIASRACAQCAKIKHRCDVQRPCARCNRLGIECVSVESSQRRKRTSTQAKESATVHPAATQPASAAAAAAALPSSIPAPPLAFTPSETDLLGAALFSRSNLAVLTQARVRESILRVHEQLSLLPPQAAMLLQFPVKSNQLLMHLSTSMLEDDFVLFLTAGLTSEEIASPVYQTSPLSAWVRPSTRPLFSYYRSDQLECFDGNLCDQSPAVAAAGDSSADADAPPQLKMSWQPEAIAHFERWDRMHYSHPSLVRRLSKFGPSPSPLFEQAQQQLEVSNQAERMAVLRAVAKEAAKSIDDADQMAVLERHMKFMTVKHCSEPSSAGAIDPPAVRPHAQWCPLKYHDTASDAHKKSRLSANPSPHASSSAASSQSPAEEEIVCVCERAVALPMLVTVNASFERVFGYSQAEVTAFVAAEGMTLFSRRLSPPSAWPSIQRVQVSGWSHVLAVISKLVGAIQARLEAAARRSAESLAESTPADAMQQESLETIIQEEQKEEQTSDAYEHSRLPLPGGGHTDTQLLTKCGVIHPCTMRRTMAQSVRPKTETDSGGINIVGHVLEFRMTLV